MTTRAIVLGTILVALGCPLQGCAGGGSAYYAWSKPDGTTRNCQNCGRKMKWCEDQGCWFFACCDKCDFPHDCQHSCPQPDPFCDRCSRRHQPGNCTATGYEKCPTCNFNVSGTVGTKPRCANCGTLVEIR